MTRCVNFVSTFRQLSVNFLSTFCQLSVKGVCVPFDSIFATPCAAVGCNRKMLSDHFAEALSGCVGRRIPQARGLACGLARHLISPAVVASAVEVVGRSLCRSL